MSADQDQARLIAERVARRLSPSAGAPARMGDGGDDESPRRADELAALRDGLIEIQRRLAHIESHITHDESCLTSQKTDQTRRFDLPRRDENFSLDRARGGVVTATRSPWLSGTYVPATAHPSDERFGIGEAVSELVDYFESEKTCAMEPGAKPCDQCGMCSSRGF